MIENNEPKTNKSFSSGVTPDKESDILLASVLIFNIIISKNISLIYANIMPLYFLKHTIQNILNIFTF